MEFHPLRFITIIALVLSLPSSVNPGEPEAADPWAPVRVLLGEWQGVGVGFGGESRVHHTYEFILQCSRG